MLEKTNTGELALLLVFSSKAISRIHQNKRCVHSAVLAKINTSASKPGGQACTGIGFCKQSYQCRGKHPLELIVVCKPGGQANNNQDKISNGSGALL